MLVFLTATSCAKKFLLKSTIIKFFGRFFLKDFLETSIACCLKTYVWIVMSEKISLG